MIPATSTQRFISFVAPEPVELPSWTEASVVVEAAIPDYAIGYQFSSSDIRTTNSFNGERIKTDIEESGPYRATVGRFHRYSRGRP